MKQRWMCIVKNSLNPNQIRHSTASASERPPHQEDLGLYSWRLGALRAEARSLSVTRRPPCQRNCECYTFYCNQLRERQNSFFIVLQKYSNGALHDGSNGDCRGQMQQQAMKTAAAAQMIKESVQSHKPGPFHLERSQIQHEFGHLLQLEGAATPG